MRRRSSMASNVPDSPLPKSSENEETPYDAVPRASNMMGMQSVSVPALVPESSDICVVICCDTRWPPCCDRVGALDFQDVPDHELCEIGVTWFQRLQYCLFFEFGKVSKLCSWYCTPFNRIFGWSKVADLTVDFFKLCGSPDTLASPFVFRSAYCRLLLLQV